MGLLNMLDDATLGTIDLKTHETLKDELMTAQQELRTTQEQVTKQTQEIKALELQLTQSQDTVSQLHDKLIYTETSLVQKDVELYDLRSQLDNLKQRK